jgi:CRISPR system Cascade subunit CasC
MTTHAPSAGRFLVIHTLTGYNAVLLNRDDAGLAKRITFGGASRTRISSQCIKKHWRQQQGAFALSAVGDTAVRSREIFSRLIAEPLQQEGFATESLILALQTVQEDLYGESAQAKAGKKKTEAAPALDVLDRKELVILGWPEIRYLTQIVREVLQGATADPKMVANAMQERLKAEKKNLEHMRRTAEVGLDVAMFGRMVTGDMNARVDAAVHVAHAFTVAAQEVEQDFFTAVDDLTGDEHAGAAHAGVTELTSGLFYHCTVVDVPLLVSNLTGVKAQDWRGSDTALAQKLLEHLVQLAATVSPGAKKGSTAPYSTADFVCLEVLDSLPMTLANAFRTPVNPRKGDELALAVAALNSYVTGKDSMMGTPAASIRRWQAQSDATLPLLPQTQTGSLPGIAAAAAAAAVA